jgi:predicted amidohydrolase
MIDDDTEKGVPSMKRRIEAAFLQFRPRFGEIARNGEKVCGLLAALDVHLAVLPELASTGYCFESREQLEGLAETPSGSLFLAALEAVCRRKKMHVVTGFAERCGSRVYNSTALLSPRGLMGVYRKMHLFDEEKFLFDRARGKPVVFDTGFARVGLAVCFDWVFPEMIRTLALRGAEIICHPANLVLSYCQDAMITRSLENRIFTITANRVGTETGKGGRKRRFTGRSQIVSPEGAILAQAPPRGECIGVASIHPGEARDKFLTPNNNLFEDRRRDFYRL